MARAFLLLAVLAASGAVAASVAVPPADAAPGRPKSLTITFAATGGSERDDISATFRSSPVCAAHYSLSQHARDIAWRAKWRKVKLPARGRRRTAGTPVELAGAVVSDSSLTYDPGCGQPSDPPRHCDQPFTLTDRAEVTLSREGSRFAVAVRALPDGGAEEVAPPARAAQSEEEDPCAPGLRGDAFAATVTVPGRSSKAVVVPVDQNVNSAGPEGSRPHEEAHMSDGEVTYDVVSDVAWGGVVTVRYNRR